MSHSFAGVSAEHAVREGGADYNSKNPIRTYTMFRNWCPRLVRISLTGSVKTETHGRDHSVLEGATRRPHGKGKWSGYESFGPEISFEETVPRPGIRFNRRLRG